MMLFILVLFAQEYSAQEIEDLTRACHGGEGKYCAVVGLINARQGELEQAINFYTEGCLYGSSSSCKQLQQKTGYFSDYYQIELRSKCKKQNSEACYQLAVLSWQNDKKEDAHKLFQYACKYGHQIACQRLNYRDSLILLYSSVILIGIACFIIVRTIFLDEDQFKASETLEEASKSTSKNDHGLILKYSRPFFKRYISPMVSTLKNKKKIQEKYKQKLASAGLTDYIDTEDFYAFKLFLIIGFPIVFLFLRVFLEEHWPLKLVFPLAIVGFFYPDFWIRSKIAARQRHVLLEMPFIVDMLALSVEAGLDFIAAIAKILEKAQAGPLLDEFKTLLKEIKIGASRSEGLRNLAWRVDMIQVSSFCATLIAADSVGASIGPILKSLSNEIRVKRSSDVEKAGATASTKILFPMIFFIIPAVFIIVMGPLILQSFGGGS